MGAAKPFGRSITMEIGSRWGPQFGKWDDQINKAHASKGMRVIAASRCWVLTFPTGWTGASPVYSKLALSLRFDQLGLQGHRIEDRKFRNSSPCVKISGGL